MVVGGSDEREGIGGGAYVCRDVGPMEGDMPLAAGAGGIGGRSGVLTGEGGGM